MTEDEKAQGMAANMGKNASQKDIDNVAAKLGSMNRGPLAAIWDKIQAMWRAFNSPATPAHIKALIIGGLIYAVSPLDVVPDFIPVVGLLDDAGVIGMVFSQLLRLGIIAGITYTVIKFLDLPRLIEELKKKQEALAREKHRKAVSAEISGYFKKDNVNYIKSDLYDKDEQLIDTVEIQAEQVDESEIYKGRKISLTD